PLDPGSPQKQVGHGRLPNPSNSLAHRVNENRGWSLAAQLQGAAGLELEMPRQVLQGRPQLFRRPTETKQLDIADQRQADDMAAVDLTSPPRIALPVHAYRAPLLVPVRFVYRQDEGAILQRACAPDAVTILGDVEGHQVGEEADHGCALAFAWCCQRRQPPLQPGGQRNPVVV